MAVWRPVSAFVERQHHPPGQRVAWQVSTWPAATSAASSAKLRSMRTRPRSWRGRCRTRPRCTRRAPPARRPRRRRARWPGRAGTGTALQPVAQHHHGGRLGVAGQRGRQHRIGCGAAGAPVVAAGGGRARRHAEALDDGCAWLARWRRAARCLGLVVHLVGAADEGMGDAGGRQHAAEEPPACRGSSGRGSAARRSLHRRTHGAASAGLRCRFFRSSSSFRTSWLQRAVAVDQREARVRPACQHRLRDRPTG